MGPIEQDLATLEGFGERRLLPEGLVLGEWTVRGLIGRGGTAEVYRAEGARGRSAAIKVLTCADEAGRTRFRREIEWLSTLETPHVPAFYGSGVVGERPYLVEELLVPQDLPQDDRACARLLLAVCEGVSALHRQGLVHRDLKPDNVLFRADGTPVIVDLGLARRSALGDLPTETSVVDGRPVGVGTPGYAAPEQMLGEQVSPAADIHALGVMIDRCFDGRPPHAWVPIVRRATSSLPDKRYRSVEDLARAIRRRHLSRALQVLLVLALALPLFVLVRHPDAGMGTGLREEESVRAEPPAPAPEVESFPKELRLDGSTKVFPRPVRLEGGQAYRITGPGTVDVDLMGPSNAVVVLSNCTFINRSAVRYPANGVRYRLDGGVYLNFINQKRQSGDSLRHPAVIWPYDAAVNEVRRSGPEKVSDLERVRLSP